MSQNLTHYSPDVLLGNMRPNTGNVLKKHMIYYFQRKNLIL